jgi:hypothetical protein
MARFDAGEVTRPNSGGMRLHQVKKRKKKAEKEKSRCCS